jgi:hypothetical protein
MAKTSFHDFKVSRRTHKGPGLGKCPQELERILSVLQAALLGHQDQRQQHIHLQVTAEAQVPQCDAVCVVVKIKSIRD